MRDEGNVYTECYSKGPTIERVQFIHFTFSLFKASLTAGTLLSNFDLSLHFSHSRRCIEIGTHVYS